MIHFCPRLQAARPILIFNYASVDFDPHTLFHNKFKNFKLAGASNVLFYYTYQNVANLLEKIRKNLSKPVNLLKMIGNAIKIAHWTEPIVHTTKNN